VGIPPSSERLAECVRPAARTLRSAILSVSPGERKRSRHARPGAGRAEPRDLKGIGSDPAAPTPYPAERLAAPSRSG
jgi:hypothetical protein